MKNWHCYCAICGGPLESGTVKISSQPRTAEFLQRQERRRQPPGESASQDSDTNSQYDSREERTYDPEIINESQIRWIDTVHAIGYNAASPHVDKAFITTPGRPLIHSRFMVNDNTYRNASDRPMEFYMNSWSPRHLAVYPFHWCCFELLLQAITGTTDVDRLDKDTLYNVMSDLERKRHLALALDYGHPKPSVDEPRWKTRAGEELLVSHPTSTPGLTQYLRTTLTKPAAAAAPGSPTDLAARLRHKVRRDPFATLPYDILAHCVRFLPNASLLALCQASLPVHAAFDDGRFWKRRIRQSMPWFFEAAGLLEDADDIDPRRLFVWAETMTRPERGLRGVLRMGITNRRRIWGVCCKLAARYDKRLPLPPRSDEVVVAGGEAVRQRQQQQQPPSVATAKSIMAAATNPHMPPIPGPDPRRKSRRRKLIRKTVRTQWIRAWDDVGAPGTAVETAWDKRGCFAGIGVEIRGERRRFGGGGGWEEKGMNVCRRELPAGVWIDGIVLHIGQRTTGVKRGGGSYCFVAGVEVSCNDGSSIAMGSCAPEHVKRPLMAGGNMVVVGLTGQMVNGKITRMGLIEHLRPGASFIPRPDPKPLLARELAWKSDAHEQLAGGRRLWELPSLHLSTPPEFSLGEPLIDSLSPFQALVWGTSEEELQSLCRLSGLVAIRRGDCTRLRGLEAQYTGSGPESRRVELRKFFGGVSDVEGHSEVHLEIDGAGGERVTGVGMRDLIHGSVFKLHTNRGREIQLGEANRPDWVMFEVPAGNTIVGLAIQQRTEDDDINCVVVLSMPL